jgi:hypothetical protein
VVVSAAFVARRMPGENPIGARVADAVGRATLTATIVGVVGDVRTAGSTRCPSR